MGKKIGQKLAIFWSNFCPQTTTSCGQTLLFLVFSTILHHYYTLNVARLLQIDVECIAKFALVRGNLSKRVFCLKTHRFLPLYVLGNRSKTLLLPIKICKRTDVPTASRLRSDGTSPKSHRLDSNHHRAFCYKKNMKSIQRVIDTTSLITRLYAYGKDGMTFASINGGNEYVQDTTYTSEIRIATLDCSNFTNPYQMLEYANMRLADYASPRISYVLKAMDLSVLTGYEHETWELGDTVMVKDDDLNLSVKTRIVRREYNLQEPWNTVLELSTTLRELGDSSSRWDSAADTLESTDLIDSQEMKDLVPFNHLRNSRADSGLTYWQNSGFAVDADNGVSGTASFKCEGALNTTKSLSQTITPANRQCYTFSAQIASENLSKGTNGQVGIEVTFEYEDGTTETRFIHQPMATHQMAADDIQRWREQYLCSSPG